MENVLTNFTTYINAQEFSLLFLLMSFLGGVIASLSPCSLGILPLVVGYVMGENEKKPLKTFFQMSSFVLGLALVLTFIGIICALGGKVFVSFGGDYWVLFLASLILIFGLDLMGIIEINLPPVIKKIPKNRGASLFFYPFLIGIMFALAATPCSTPILVAIMGFATLSGNIIYAALMLFLFSLGQGAIIVLAGVFTSFITKIKGFASHGDILMKFAGAILVIAALLIYWKIFNQFFN